MCRSPLFISFIGNFGWSSEHVQANKCGLSYHLKGYSHHHSTKKHPLNNSIPIKLDVYTLILPQTSQTSCPRSTSLYFEILGWSSRYLWMNEFEATDLQIEQGWIKMKGMHLFYQLQGGSQLHLHQSCSDETLKVINPISFDCDTYFKKPPIFLCVFTFKASQRILINSFKTSISRSNV